MGLVQQIRKVAKALEDQGRKVVFAESCTGGLVAASLARMPGISRFLCGGMVVYRVETKAEYLGIPAATIERLGVVSAPLTQLLATAVLERTPEADIALAITGHLGPGAPRKLDGVAYVAIAERDVHGALPATPLVAEVTLASREREQRQKDAAEAALLLLAEALTGSGHACHDPHCVEHHPTEEATDELTADVWKSLTTGELAAFCLGGPDNAGDQPSSGVIFPGSFNPLHEGHRRMAALAAETTGRPVEFLISIENVDKPALTRKEALRRAKQFAPAEPLWIVRSAMFVEMAELFPGSQFIVGCDTILRIGDPKFYRGGLDGCREAIRRLARQECRFLVFGRKLAGEFQSLRSLDLPAALRKLCREVPEERFRADVSSTALRSARKSQA